MKKLILISALASFISYCGYSQTMATEFVLGKFTGLTLSMNVIDEKDTSYNVRFQNQEYDYLTVIASQSLSKADLHELAKTILKLDSAEVPEEGSSTIVLSNKTGLSKMKYMKGNMTYYTDKVEGTTLIRKDALRLADYIKLNIK